MDFDQADALNEAIRAVGIRHRALAIAALAPYGVHPGHKLVVFELDAAGPCTLAQLAAATGFEPPTITLSIRQLEDAGLVIRRPSPTDRRATLVELSEQGRALLPELKAAWCRLAEQTVAGFAVIPLDQLTEILAHLAASLDASHDPATGDPLSEPPPALPRSIGRSAGRRRLNDPRAGGLPRQAAQLDQLQRERSGPGGHTYSAA
ncbi:MAG: MarR family transcriptional regulator [Streptosporangiaceae bacterium]|nr:MarR family transcriptional regulator [Streptosporangiaceae bacterium]